MSRCVHWKPGPDLICFVAANVLMSYWYNSWWDMNFPHISVNCCHSSTQYFSKERNVLCVLKMGQISSSHTLWQKDIFTAFFIPAGKSEQTVTCEWPQVFNYEKKVSIVMLRARLFLFTIVMDTCMFSKRVEHLIQGHPSMECYDEKYHVKCILIV